MTVLQKWIKTKYRPASTTQWMKEADRAYELIPINISLVDWRLWWMENQPSERGPVWPPRWDDSEDIDWAGFKTGKNGILMLIVSLARIAQFMPCATTELKEAVAEVYYSLIKAASLPWLALMSSKPESKRKDNGPSHDTRLTKYTSYILLAT
jgi:hypothetical protein